MLTRLAQRLWCSMQRVQRCVRGINASFKGIWAPHTSSTTSSTSPLTETQASVPAAAIYQASAAPYRSPCNIHQPMAHWFMSGGPPSVRPLHSRAGHSTPALQQDGVAGGHGNVSTAVSDLDLASDGESEVFEDANEEMQPDLLHTEAPLQVKAAVSFVHCLASMTNSSQSLHILLHSVYGFGCSMHASCPGNTCSKSCLVAADSLHAFGFCLLSC